MIELKFTKTISLNELLDLARTNKFAAAQAKERATMRAKLEAQEQTNIKIIAKIYIAYEITYSTETSDGDNLNGCLKPILDGIVKAGVLRDDSLKYLMPYSFMSYVKAPRKSQYIKIKFFITKDDFKNYINSQIL